MNVNLGEAYFQPLDSMKILGVLFDRQLNWNAHVAKVIRTCSSVSYSLRVLNNILPRKIHKEVIFSHFISHLTYASPIWGGTISYRNKGKLSSCLNKALRLHCYDFKRELSNEELYAKTGIRSFKSMISINDKKMLFKLVTQPTSLYLTGRLTSQTVLFLRFPGKIGFTDLSRKRIGRNSFINRAKKICESIPFEWTDCSINTFSQRIKKTTPMNLMD